MNDITPSDDSARQIKRAFRREVWLAQGRVRGFEFALDNAEDVQKIEDEIHEQEEIMSNSFNSPHMAPGASPQVHIEGYVTALKEAISLISTLKRLPFPRE